MSVKKYRKKPVTIEAIQLNIHNVREVAEWCGADLGYTFGSTEPDALDIPTLEGTMAAHITDYIIRGVQGEFYPCKPDIFAATYEEVRADEEAMEKDSDIQDSLERAHDAMLDAETAKGKAEQAYEQAVAEEEYQYGVTYTGLNHGGQHFQWVENTGDAEWDKETLQWLIKRWKKQGQSPKIVRRRVSPPEVME